MHVLDKSHILLFLLKASVLVTIAIVFVAFISSIATGPAIAKWSKKMNSNKDEQAVV
jgi:hypothetical protein